MSGSEEETYSTMFTSLRHPARRKILRMLAEKPRTPFEKVISQGGDPRAALEIIDIGGPNVIRAAVKNFENVVVITNPRRYRHVLKELKEKGDVSIQTRSILATEAFKETARYDRVIYKFFEKGLKRLYKNNRK